MEKEETGTGGISETQLIALLASLKAEPAPEADFESRFLGDLRERLARESVCCSARRLLWDHIVQVLVNFGPRRLAYGASALGLGALAAGYFVVPEQEAPSASVAVQSPLSRLESSLASLRSTSGQETAACTTIRVGGQRVTPYTEAGLASGVFPASFERSSTPADHEPVDMGFGGNAVDTFRPYTSAVGF